ncbi:MAG TPA: protein kinase [Polyangiaceae bacterium]|jgi:WD40 repeat protein
MGSGSNDDREGKDRNETWPSSMVFGSSPPGPRPSGDRYELGRERARGGLGRVMEAEDRQLRRTVAVKELIHRDAPSEARFVREAFITARLEHPSIVPVYDAATSPEGAPFYVMKLVSGRTLEELVAACRTPGERLALLPNVIAVADAIAYAHSQGVLHRDIKGSNVIVGEFGETIVIDWGLAKRIEDVDERAVTPRAEDTGTSDADPGPGSDDPGNAVTVEGAIVGTPLFMAPEQARGERADARTDVFALGGLLYFVLGGRAPYADVPIRRLLAEIREGRPRLLRDREPGIAPDLAAIVDRAMAPARDARYPGARELADDLRTFRNGGLVAAHRYTTADRVARSVRRHLGVTLATGLFVLAGALGFGVVALREQSLRRAAEQARDRAAAEQALADRQALALLEQRGRDELEGGRPFRAAVLLSDAYLHDPDSLAVRSLLTEALRPLAARRLSLAGHGRDVPAGAYSPDGSLVATGSDDRTVRLWDERTGAPVRTISGFEGALEWVAFSHDGKALATSAAGQHPRIAVWEVPSGRPLSSFPMSRANFRVELTPDDSALVVGSFDGDLRILDRVTGATRLDTRACKDRISSIEFRPGTSQMLVASFDHTVTIWDWQKAVRVAALEPFDHRVSSAHFSRDGRYFLVAESERSLHVYDASRLVRLRTLALPETALDPDAFFSPDARAVIAGTKDGRIRVWHTSSGALLRLIDAQPAGQLYRMALRGDGAEVATMGGSGAVNLWSLDADLDYRILGHEPVDDTSVLASSYFDGGRGIVMPTAEGQVHVLDGDGTERSSFHIGASADTSAVGAHATRLGVAGETPRSFPPRLWDLRTGALVANLEPQAPPSTYGLAVSNDGEAFFTGDYVGVLREWDAVTGAARGEHPVTSARISSVAASPDGRTIAVASEHGTVFFVDRATGETRSTLQAHGCWIQSMTYADAGATLVTVGRQDHTLKVWRAPFDTPVLLSGHVGAGERASLSDDGRRIASVSGDGTARLWDAHTGELLRVIRGPSTTAAFRPGTNELLTTGDHGYEVVWDTTLDPRSPAEIAAYVAKQSPWRLVDGRLVLESR